MPSLSSISTVWQRVLQSDLEPMITPTSALIVLPHVRAPHGATKTNKPRRRRGLACQSQPQLQARSAAQYTARACAVDARPAWPDTWQGLFQDNTLADLVQARRAMANKPTSRASQSVRPRQIRAANKASS